LSCAATVNSVIAAPSDERKDMIMTETLHPFLPVGRDWLISLSEKDRVVEAYDAETLRPLFSGRYISPREYGSKDPRAWSDRKLRKLLSKHGLYSGTRSHGAIYVLAEVVALVVLMRSVSDASRRQLEQMALKEALATARDLYSDYIQESASGPEF
jgi:hypothetical protein